jgi:hypothetical protein
MGGVGFMSRHHDKLIARLTAPEPPPRRTDPRTRQEVESFVKGFGLSTSATLRLVQAWTEDIDLAESRGYHQGAEDASPY